MPQTYEELILLALEMENQRNEYREGYDDAVDMIEDLKSDLKTIAQELAKSKKMNSILEEENKKLKGGK